ncbi:hypothetical protein CVT24_006919 [Panaeolus cyanescens]|uniref:Uncharacterized protein n=1 Tax=Panaeolus cyanescens TaxID=181874 RepID=A0A409VK37_9AGAR|nr:hypothetical protein CVT24_006919 [Panaeolus cyanescens]
MLGSVFNGHQRAKGGDKPIKTILRTFTAKGTPIGYSEFRGIGAPPAEIGVEGDVFIDITDNSYNLYARYASQWKKWPGPSFTGPHLKHPNHSDRILSIKNTIGWFASINQAIKDQAPHQAIASVLEREETMKVNKSHKRKNIGPEQEPPLKHQKVSPMLHEKSQMASTNDIVRQAGAPNGTTHSDVDLASIRAVPDLLMTLRNDVPLHDLIHQPPQRWAPVAPTDTFQDPAETPPSPIPSQCQHIQLPEVTPGQDMQMANLFEQNEENLSLYEPTPQRTSTFSTTPIRDTSTPIHSTQHISHQDSTIAEITPAPKKIDLAELMRKRRRSTQRRKSHSKSSNSKTEILFICTSVFANEMLRLAASTPGPSVPKPTFESSSTGTTATVESQPPVHPPASQQLIDSSSVSIESRATSVLSTSPIIQSEHSAMLTSEIQLLRMENSALRKRLNDAVPFMNTRPKNIPIADEIGVHEATTDLPTFYPDIPNGSGLLVSHVPLACSRSPCDKTPKKRHLIPSISTDIPKANPVPVEEEKAGPLLQKEQPPDAKTFHPQYQPPQSTFPIPEIEVLPIAAIVDDANESSSAAESDAEWDSSSIASHEEDELVDEGDLKDGRDHSVTYELYEDEHLLLNHVEDQRGKSVEPLQGANSPSIPIGQNGYTFTEPDRTRSNQMGYRTGDTFAADVSQHGPRPPRASVTRTGEGFVREFDEGQVMAPIIADDETGASNTMPKMVPAKRNCGGDGGENNVTTKREMNDESLLRGSCRSPVSVSTPSLKVASLAGSDTATKGEISNSKLLCRLCLGDEDEPKVYQVEADVLQTVLQEHCTREHYETCEQLVSLTEDELRALDSQPPD